MAQTTALTTGFETGDSTDLSILGSGASIQSTTVRTGGYALKQAVSGSRLNVTLSSTQTVFRFYFRVPAVPGAATIIINESVTGGVARLRLRLTTAAKLQLVDAATTLGLTTANGTAVLSVNTWYRIEMTFDLAAGGVAKVSVDGVTDINTTHTTDVSATPTVTYNFAGAANPNEYFFDDVQLDRDGLTAIGAGSSQRLIVAGVGSHALTGTSATLKNTRVIAAAAGSYALTGTIAALKNTHVIAAAASSYAHTGTSATLRKNAPLVAGAGTYALAGTSATLRKSSPLVAAAGSYALTGTNAALGPGRKTFAATGSYALTGAAATLRTGSILSASVGSYALTGSAAQLHLTAFTTGFETGDSTDLSLLGTGASIQSTTVRTGGYALKQAVSVSRLNMNLGATQSVIRFYFRVPTLPGANTNIAEEVGSAARLRLRFASTNKLGFLDANATLGLTAVNGTTTINVNQWYRIEMFLDLAAGGICKLLLDGNVEINTTHTTDVSATPTTRYEFQGAAAPNEYFFDDVRVDRAGLDPIGAGSSQRLVAAGVGSYALTGTSAALKIARTVAAGASSYALTGTAAALKTGYKTIAGVGAHSLIGTAATVRIGHKVTLGAAAYALTGATAVLYHGYRVVGAVGSYTLNGQSVSFKPIRKITAGAGSYNLAGDWASLTYQRSGHFVLATDVTGEYTVDGTAAGLRHGDKIAAGVGAYQLTGSAALSHAGRQVSASFGSYSLTGTAATLRHRGKITAGLGAYALTGAAASVRKARLIFASTGAYSLSGSAASFRHKWRVAAAVGNYQLSGATAGLRAVRRLSVSAGSYSLSGNAIVPRYSGALAYRLDAGANSYTLTGTSADLIVVHRTILHGGLVTSESVSADGDELSIVTAPADRPFVGAPL